MGYIIFLAAIVALLIAFMALVMAKGGHAEDARSGSNVTSKGPDSEVHAEMPENYPESSSNEEPFPEERL